MGKSHLSAGKLQEFARIAAFHKRKPTKSVPKFALKPKEVKVQSEAAEVKKEKKIEESSLCFDGKNRVPLSQVVSGCSKRWFQDTLKEARFGDTSMQLLVGQMYFSGYGAPKNKQEGLYWIRQASKSYPLAWKMSLRHPGYDSIDSDSDHSKDDAKKVR